MARRKREWLQLNVALARRNGSALASARFVLRELESLFSSQCLDRQPFFFQRKAPDLRLRFFDVRESLVRRLRPVISHAKAEGHISRHFYSVYEPEYRQFGGPACMQAVHAFWSTDSFAWIAMDRLAESGSFAIPHSTLITSVLDDLFWRILSDRGEVWDTWCNLATILRDGTGDEDKSPSIHPLLGTIKQTATASETELIVRYQQANVALAEGFSKAWQTGRMQCGVRSILPYVALFTLNRHGFDQAKASTVARAMATIWNPKQHLKGAEPASAKLGATEALHLAQARQSGRQTKGND